jgi:hypothetical protein
MYRILAVALALALAPPAAAADRFDPDARAAAIAPFVDPQTVVVAHADLARIDLDGLVRQVAAAGELDAQEAEALRRELGSWLPDLTRAGGKELYAGFSLADLAARPPFFVVVPLAAGADAAAVRRELGRGKALEALRFETRDRAVVGGSAATLKRLGALRPGPRPELARAFAAAGDTAAQVVLLPPADTGRVLDELLPTLPPELGGGSSRPLAHGLRWAALGVDLPPQAELRLVVQSSDADASRALDALLVRARDALGRLRDVRDLLPDFDKVAGLLASRVEGDRVVVTVNANEARVVLPGPVRRLAGRRAGADNLRRLASAMHNYAEAHQGRFPAAASFDRQGKPLLSWRVLLLPFVGEGNLYREFRLDEPWDSPHNRELIGRMPGVYQGLDRKLNREGKTYYLAAVGPAVAFSGGPEGARMPADFSDGTANTILLVEADSAHAVPWTKPEDLKIDLEQPQQGLGGHFPGEFLVALADGEARFLRKAIRKETLRAAFTRAGGEVLGPDW